MCVCVCVCVCACVCVGGGGEGCPHRYRHEWQYSDWAIAYYRAITRDKGVRPACASIIREEQTDPTISLSKVRVGYCSKLLAFFHIFCEVTTAFKESSTGIELQSVTEHNLSSPVSLVGCPLGHTARIFLACDIRSKCWSRDAIECRAPLTPLPPSFTCTNGVEGVPYTFVCDIRPDCSDDSDETFCVYPPCDLPGALQCNDKEVRLTSSDRCELACGMLKAMIHFCSRTYTDCT